MLVRLLTRLPIATLLAVALAATQPGCSDDDYGNDRPAQDAAAPGQSTDLAHNDLAPAVGPTDGTGPIDLIGADLRCTRQTPQCPPIRAGDGGVCPTPQCDDCKKDQDETDIDCGGTVCLPCGTGKLCFLGTDCESTLCTAQPDGTATCDAPKCNDGVQNGSESDVDCGGGTCTPCAAGKKCVLPKDCQSMICTNRRCK